MTISDVLPLKTQSGRTQSKAKGQFINRAADCAERVEKINRSEVHEPIIVYFFARNSQSHYGADNVGCGTI